MELVRKKRERGLNFSLLETTKLVELAVGRKDILEKKVADPSIWREKNEEWQRVADDFNLNFKSHRNAKTLKLKYKGVKKNLKKKIADNQKLTGAMKVKLEDFEHLLVREVDLEFDGLSSFGDLDQSFENDDADEFKPNIDEGFENAQVEEENVYPENSRRDTLRSKSCSATKKHWLRLNPAKLKKTNACSDKGVEILTEAKLNLVKAELQFLEKEEERKILVHNEVMRNLKEENERNKELHEIKKKILGKPVNVVTV